MTPPAELALLLKEALVSPAAAEPAAGAIAPPAQMPDLIDPPRGDRLAADSVLRWPRTDSSGKIHAAVLGAGDYSRTEIIPALRRARFCLYSVATREPQIAAMIGRDYGFALATTAAAIAPRASAMPRTPWMASSAPPENRPTGWCAPGMVP